GLSHTNSDGAYLGINETTKQIDFVGKEFRLETKTAQWEVVGTKLDACFLRNRLTGGVLYQQTIEEDVPQGEDREELTTASDTWYVAPLKNGHPITYHELISLVDMKGKTVNFVSGGDFTRVDGFPPTTRIETVKSWDGKNRGSVQNATWLHLFNNHDENRGAVHRLLMIHKDQRVLASKNWKDWERLEPHNREGVTRNNTLYFGNKVAIKSWHNTWMRIEGGGYRGNKDEDPDLSYFYVLPAGFNDNNMNGHQSIFKREDNDSRTPIKGFFAQISLANGNNAYGVTHTNKLFHYDGNQWNYVQTSFSPMHVSISSKGDLCCVDIQHKLWTKQSNAWNLADGDWNVASIRNANEIWLVGKDGGISKYNGSSAEASNLPQGKATWISVSEAGNVWAIGKNNTIWRYDLPTKNWLLMPGQGKRIAVRNDNDVWIIGMDDALYRFTNNNWHRIEAIAQDIAVASGVTVNKILAPRKKESVTAIRTTNPDNTPYGGDDTSKISIDIEKLGMGGALGPKTSFDFAGIPAAQHPRISGFAVDRLDEFDPTAILSVNPLVSKGAAWLETSLKKPDVGGVAFMVRVRDAGDAQVVFGPEMSNSFAYKVIFGGWNNTKSAIVKREYVNGDPVDTVVYELTVDQYPTARIPSGVFTSYWVSIENGFIMAGMGAFGENVFMAWRDPNPKRGITRVGFSSHKAPVQYNNIKITPPAAFSSIPRVFTKILKQFPVSTGGSVTWSENPFRTNDRGSLQCSIVGTQSAAVILARKKNTSAPHYAIVFGDDNNAAITIKKWHTGQKKYNERARIKLDPLPAFKIDAKRRKTFWVSFYFGQIVIGSGELGTDPIYIFQDLAPIDNIDSVGFSNLGDGSVTFSNLEIGAPLVLRAQQQEQSYDKSSGPQVFGGGLTIILPFDYELSQEDQVVKLTDYVLGQSFYLGATPQQGAIYSFQATINANGAISLDWTKAPENQKQLEIQRAVMKVKNEAELNKIEADRLRAQGAIDQTLKIAAGDKLRATVAAISQTGQTIASMGATTAGAMAAAGPLGAAIAAGIAGASMAAGSAMVAGSTAMSIQAANKDYQGAELKAAQERQAAQLEAAASMKQQQADASAGLATVGLRSSDSYVFLDKPGARPDMGTQDTSEAAKRNRADAEAKLAEATNIRPTAIEDMIRLSLLYLDMVMLANQSSVLSGDSSFKTRFLNGVDKLLHAYLDTVSSNPDVGTPLHQDMLTLLLNAYNNPYLINEFIPDEAQTKESWYWLVTIFGRQAIASSEIRGIKTDKFYG
ncbi:hypothetical protein FJ364_03105, partial [Candidatus Dependentiae bacterium]|nr:hypothetical protein [Candidatus Dependentiae bacterium]